jgi:hypothetical protein
MKTGTFLMRLLKRGGTELVKIPFISKDVSRLAWWDFKFALAEATDTIDYGCDFNKSGLCKRKRRDRKSSKMCCCAGCYYTMGYLDEIPINLADISKIAKHFTIEDKQGFWRKDSGCILPRKYRSNVCLTYNCYSLSPEDRFLIRLLDKKVSDDLTRDLRKMTWNMWKVSKKPMRETTDCIFDKHLTKKQKAKLDLTGRKM